MLIVIMCTPIIICNLYLHNVNVVLLLTPTSSDFQCSSVACYAPICAYRWNFVAVKREPFAYPGNFLAPY